MIKIKNFFKKKKRKKKDRSRYDHKNEIKIGFFFLKKKYDLEFDLRKNRKKERIVD